MFKKQTSLGRLRANLRQLKYPPELRIAEPTWPENFFEQLGGALARRAPREETAEGLREGQITAIGTRLWRLRKELETRVGASADETLSRTHSQLETLWSLLAQEGVDIYDHTGQIMPKKGYFPFLKVIAYQPVDNLGRERVIETVRPTIRLNGKIVQAGEVIVGTPEAED